MAAGCVLGVYYEKHGWRVHMYMHMCVSALSLSLSQSPCGLMALHVYMPFPHCYFEKEINFMGTMRTMNHGWTAYMFSFPLSVSPLMAYAISMLLFERKLIPSLH